MRKGEYNEQKNHTGLILFGSITLAGLLVGVDFMISQGSKIESQNNSGSADQDSGKNPEATTPAQGANDNSDTNDTVDINKTEPWLSTNPSDSGDSSLADNADKTNSNSDITGIVNPSGTAGIPTGEGELGDTTDVLGSAVHASPDLELIDDSSKVDYKAYIPEMVTDSSLKAALDISNPDISVDAKAAILLDADTKKVLFYKNAVDPIFPASTAKLLTSLVALDWCTADEEVTIGDEVKMIATDATKAYLKPGEVLTIHNLLEGMLLPSGNDAAYATAAYVGRKSLKNPNAAGKEAIVEFAKLMNLKAKELGAKNSCFKSPDGYDALGQYTTAYDMGMVGIAAATNDTILSIAKKSSSRNIFVSGEDVTWNNTNSLISRYSGRYYPYAIGLKTGTSTMAGRCLISAASKDGKVVVSVVMNSSSSGRWDDSTRLLDYGLK
jgi:D-alanyl-D-alanine carboxypeptidase (penicillin-binding protein 5/6)